MQALPRPAGVAAQRPGLSRSVALLLALFLALSGVIAMVAPPPASAAVYRYWGYYQADAKGTWAFATKGAAQTKPADGSVEGWRFAIVGTQPRLPRTTPAFDDVCGSTQTESGKKRVAVYIDYGVADEAPEGGGTPPDPKAACAVVPSAATGQDALEAVSTVRVDKTGLFCGIDSYPSTGCSDEVKTAPKVPNPEPAVEFAVVAATPTPTTGASPDTTASDTAAPAEDSNTLTYVLVAVVVVALLGGGGLLLARRRRGDGTEGSA